MFMPGTAPAFAGMIRYVANNGSKWQNHQGGPQQFRKVGCVAAFRSGREIFLGAQFLRA
jgi:hypothetical protein